MNDTPETTTEFLPDVANRYRILDILFKNPVDCPIEKIVENINNMTSDNIRSTITRIRRDKNSNLKFVLMNNTITTTINGKKPTEKDIKQNLIDGNNNIDPRTKPRGKSDGRKIIKGSTASGIINLLNKCPDGLSCIDLQNKLKKTKTSIYSAIYMLRKNGYRITQFGEMYSFQNNPNENKSEYTPQHHYQYKNDEIKQIIPLNKLNNELIPKEYYKSFENLPDNDKLECINFLKKSIYYRKSALAIIESNQLALELCKNLIEKDG